MNPTFSMVATPDSFRINIPAKINLNLRVEGLRADGYHKVATLMTPVDLYDTVEIRRRPGPPEISLDCPHPGVPAGEENLACLAARVFCEETGWSAGLSIQIEKRVPPGAGLGGGSSNAAAVLLGLNRLSGQRLHAHHLEAMAARLGSDVPWFIRAETALCKGRGEILEAAPRLPSWPLLLVKPPFGIPTPWAYRAWDIMGDPQQPSRNIEGIPVFNDLEPPVMEKYVFLSALKNWLESRPGVRLAAMSGSGSTLFAILEESANTGALIRDARAFAGSTLWTHPGRLL